MKPKSKSTLIAGFVRILSAFADTPDFGKSYARCTGHFFCLSASSASQSRKTATAQNNTQRINMAQH